jgi:integrase
MPLSDTKVRTAKAGPKPKKLSDGGGLYLHVTPTGSKLWRLAYRSSGKQRTLALGIYPTVSLEKARAGRAAAKKNLQDGLDPNLQKKLHRRQHRLAGKNTFDAVTEEWIDKLVRERRADITISKKRWLVRLASPAIGPLPMASLSSADILEVLRPIEKKGQLETANRLKSTIGAIFRFAIATGIVSNDPTVALRGALAAPQVRNRAAITTASELGALLRAIDAFRGQVTTRYGLQLLALLFPRPGELRAAEWSEIDFDKAIWKLPATRTKMKREHRVPLAPAALNIFRELFEITGNGGVGLVFPSLTSSQRPMSENTLNAALRRLGYAKEEMTSHGFRATASTLLNESGQWSPDAIERQLGHVESNAVRRAYLRADYWEERVRMMNWWANSLSDWKKEGSTASHTITADMKANF